MPVLRNPRYERFAQGITKGKSQHEAYLYAGYGRKEDGVNVTSTDDLHTNAGKLARKPEVADRIAELQERQAKRVGITVDALLVELQDMLLLAKRVKHPAAGVGAILAKGKLLGLITERIESDVNIRKPARRPTADKTMTMEEWKEKFAPSPDPGKDKLQ